MYLLQALPYKRQGKRLHRRHCHLHHRLDAFLQILTLALHPLPSDVSLIPDC